MTHVGGIDGRLAHTPPCFVLCGCDTGALRGVILRDTYQARFARKTVGWVWCTNPSIFLFALPDPSKDCTLGENVYPCLHARG